MEKTRPGVWRHYKGGEYDVYGEAILSGSEDSPDKVFAVIYRPRYGQRKLTYRPKKEFLGHVSVNGITMARFVFVRDFDDPCLEGIAAFFSS
ncbi:MAG: DUF1653 domain-containing protein [Minisyncoccia bacterium]